MLNQKFFLIPLFAAPFFAGTPIFADSAALPENVPAIVAPAQIDTRYTTTQEMKIETRLTAFFLERAHILEKKISETDMNAFIETDCSSLDATRSIFLQSDVDGFKARFAPTLADYMARGNLHAGFTVYKKFLERLDERLSKIDARLQQPQTFNLNRSDSLRTDRKEKIWPADEAAADELWEKRLTNELITELLGENSDEDDAAETAGTAVAGTTNSAGTPPITTSDPSPETVAAACEKLRERYAKLRANLTLEPWEVEELFLNALTAQYDPHTSFFSKQSMEEFEIMMRNSLCGIGAVLSMKDGYCTIREIMAGSPVERSGKISVGDKIVAVDKTGGDGEMVDVVGIRLSRIVRMLRGKKGVPVRLLIESAGDGSRRLVTLVRDEIKLTEQLASAEVFSVPAADGEKTVSVGVITLPSFYGKDRAAESAFSTSEDVKELLKKLKAEKIDALVLDLRLNGGGYLNEAIDLLELFVGPGVPALQTQGTSGRAEKLVTGGSIVGPAKSLFSSEPEWTGPMLVLVSKLSASASEIVAGALQDNHRALIVGDPQTHGKGSVQEVIPFRAYDASLNAAIKLTRSKWYAPSGKSIQLRGVSADIITPSVYSVLPVGEDDLEQPLPWDSVSSVLGTSIPSWMSAPISPELVKILAENSARRQAELPEFLTHNRTVAWVGEKEKNKAVPLSLRERLASRDSDREFTEFVKQEYKTLDAETGFEKREIRLDSAVEQQKESETSKFVSKKSSLRAAGTGALPGVSAAADDADEWPDYDVLLRESVRIAADWVSLLDAEKSAAPAN